MTFNEIADFLLPGSDAIQIIFGGLMVLLSAFTVVTVWRGATAANWEKKWNGGTKDDPSDDLDVEHGSVNDISAAVATTGEKLADIMPGILLMLGLLGTFLGLGIALNKASTILVEASAGGGMDSAMANLMGMMEGLGTKFKTSTWGIIAFLLMKGWASHNGYEERRLRWCVGKMKSAFEQSRIEQKRERDNAQQLLISAVTQLSDNFATQMAANREVLELQCKLQKHGSVSLATSIESVKATLETGNESILGEIQASRAVTKANGHSLAEAVRLLQEHSEQNQKQIDDVQATRVALERFIEANSVNLHAISGAASQMASAASNVGDSATQLQSTVADLQTAVGDVFSTLTKDLGATIEKMGHSFGENMDNISTNLGAATEGISRSVTELSGSVGKTLETVGSSTQQSMDMQQKAQVEFIGTSQELANKVVVMTELVKDLREKILSGLKAVSESGLRTASLNQRYAAVTEEATRSAEAITQLVAELQAMQRSNPLQPTLEGMRGQFDGIGQDLNRVLQFVSKKQEHEPESLRPGAVAQLQGVLAQIVGKLDSLDSRQEKQSVPATS